MAARHSTLLRGLVNAGSTKARVASPNGARFGRLFPDLPAATYGRSDDDSVANLELLAQEMISDFDAPKDAPDDEESGIPALYTYFGQFVDHDLTFDPATSFQKQKDPGAVIDFRTPAFDLDNIYGRGPGDQPYMYADDNSLLLGDPLTLGNKRARDLQRNAAGRALIGDPRNDENTIVSQFQGLVIRLHNALVAKHKEHDKVSFEDIQQLVRHHYQYIVLNDFLPRIVHKDVLDALKTNEVFDQSKIRFFKHFPEIDGQSIPFMPLEFSVGAYRLGHSMVRPGYRLNDATLLPIFPVEVGKHDKFPQGLPEGLTGFRRMISDWGIDWGRFIDIDQRAYGVALDDPPQVLTKEQAVANFKRLQFAYKIDTAIVHPLGNLPMTVAGNKPFSLALRNLERGFQFGLPNGQSVANAMGVDYLHDDKIIIGQDVEGGSGKPIAEISKAFAGNCPLWTYCLAEARYNHQTPAPSIPATGGPKVETPQLGPVGGRIVAEVFLGLMFADADSYLAKNPKWTPDHGTGYGLKEFVNDALAT